MKNLSIAIALGLLSVSAHADNACSYSQDGIKGRDSLVEREIQTGQLCGLTHDYILNMKNDPRLEEKYGQPLLEDMHINFIGRETAYSREIMYLNVAYPTTLNYTILRRGSATYWSDGSIDIKLY